MGMDEDWVARWTEELQKVAPNYGHFQPGQAKIFRVSEHFRASDPSAYEPKIISIGPYHRGKLQEMKQDKLLYLKNILQRNVRITLQSIMQLVYGLVPQSKSCYSGNIIMDSKEFAEMLMLDGCFIIELLLAHHHRLIHDQQNQQHPPPGGHPILDDRLTLSLLQFDMLLLENQLPYIVLKSLFNLVAAPDIENPISFVGVFTEFFQDLISGLPLITEPLPPDMDFYHLLHLYHACFIGRKITDSPTPSMLMTPSASDLMKVGVKLKKKDGRGFSWEISYEKGVIEVSPARLNSSSNSFYRNLITFEQYYFRSVRSRVMAYVMLMSGLIDSEDDLALLRRERIIAYTLEYHEATRFFRKLCKESIIDYDKSYLSRLKDRSMEVWELHNSKWNRFMAKSKRNLFSDPVYIAYPVLGFILSMALTIVQTVYALLKYYHSKQSQSSSDS